ncbi:hypothetical protein RRG08_043571 [Elysia crispata]|uniref:Uncharacterized protein n=1 Tax=Elysia crispata TaxID=231223 RepID=A0AAE1A5F7_9GAST|nr:hypothetical protein RRG08_043571 [Elysia crispata]
MEVSHCFPSPDCKINSSLSSISTRPLEAYFIDIIKQFSASAVGFINCPLFPVKTQDNYRSFFTEIRNRINMRQKRRYLFITGYFVICFDNAVSPNTERLYAVLLLGEYGLEQRFLGPAQKGKDTLGLVIEPSRARLINTNRQTVV